MSNTIARSSDAGLLNTTKYQQRTLSKKLEESNGVASSGVKGPTYNALADHAQTSQITKVDTAALNQEISTLGLIANDLNIIEDVYTRFTNIMIDVNSKALNSISTFQEHNPLQNECRLYLKEVEELLNTRSVDGGFIFSGVNDTHSPVKDLDHVAIPALGMPLTLSAISDFDSSPDSKVINVLGYKVTMGFKFDNPEILDMIHTLSIIANTPSSPKPGSNDHDLLLEALDLGEKAFQGLNGQITNLGSESQSIEKRIDRNEDRVVSNLKIIKDCDTIDEYTALNELQDIINQSKSASLAAHLFNKLFTETLQNMNR